MRRVSILAALVIGLQPYAALSDTEWQPRVDQSLRDRAARTFIVRLSDDTPRSEIASRARIAADFAGGRIVYVYEHVVKGFAIEVEPTVIGRIASSGIGVRSITRDSIVSIAASGAPVASTALQNTVDGKGETTPWGVQRVGGGLVPVPAGARVFVLDTGIADHPDLIVDRTPAFTIDRTTSDRNGHGTHVAGTIAARAGNDANGTRSGNGGVVGVAPGATVVPIRVLNDQGAGTSAGVIAGLDHVARLRTACGLPNETDKCPPQAWVANMSLGALADNGIDTAVANAAATGVRFAIAAGNDGTSATGYSPARVNGTNVLTVSASDAADLIASFSNYGNPPVDFAAPGASVLSTLPGGKYGSKSGTSMAAPHVAGVLALVPSLDADTASSNFCGVLERDRDGIPDRIVFSNLVDCPAQWAD